jgi:hypothetical protein
MLESFGEFPQNLFVLLVLALQEADVLDREVPVFPHLGVKVIKVLSDLLLETQSYFQIMLHLQAFGLRTNLVYYHHDALNHVFVVLLDDLLILLAFVIV